MKIKVISIPVIFIKDLNIMLCEWQEDAATER
jgi:hypothetical protein